MGYKYRVSKSDSNRYLASTHAGRMIQHIYFGINLAIKIGGGLHLIRDGSEYAGFIVEGDDLQVIHKNRVARSLEPNDLFIELQKLNSHAEAIRKIYELLVEIRTIGGEEELTLQEQLKSNPRLLRKMVQSRSAEDISTIRDVLGGLLEEVKYTQTYWEINTQNVLRFLNAMARGESTDDFPMFIHLEVICNRSSNILEYLSVFGGQAPSIFHGNTTRKIAKPEAIDPNLELIGGKRTVPHIPFIKKGLIAANADWMAVQRNKAFRFTASSIKSKGLGMTGFSSNKGRDGVIDNPHFDAFYATLRQWVHTNYAKQVVGSSKGKGRARENDDDDEMTGTSKKGKFSFA